MSKNNNITNDAYITHNMYAHTHAHAHATLFFRVRRLTKRSRSKVDKDYSDITNVLQGVPAMLCRN